MWDVPVYRQLRSIIGPREHTYAKNFENGKPLSRANTHISLETEAKMLNNANPMMMTRMETSTLAAADEPVML